MKRFVFITGFLILVMASFAQDTTSKIHTLDSVMITSLAQHRIRPLPVTVGTFLFSGKKSELIELSALPADIANKTGRQLFSKIPGMFVYDMDGAGNQINIASRGLDPHRGWEFNNRKDGIVTNSDMYGYPASHYSMPLESISRIELVRGTGSLQYGAQFGGMINYISKLGDTTRPFSFENISSTGSYGLVSTYNAAGGKSGAFSYYVYDYRKARKGFRDMEESRSSAQSVSLLYAPTAKLSVRAEWSRSMYVYRIPGPLTDAMFAVNPRQATRKRNYYSPDIHVPSITLNWQLSPATRMQFISSAVLGRRNSVLFDKPSTVMDTINAATGLYNNRQVDIDRFNSYTYEARLLHQYQMMHHETVLVAGIQYMQNDLHRTQLGKGSTGDDYDLTLVDPVWGRDLHFKTKNIALFAENKFQFTKKLSLTTGVRVEAGRTNMSGTIVYYPENQIPVTIHHRFPLFGLNILYKWKKECEWYAGLSQSYRPMLFKDIIPGSLFEKVDPDIQDAKGYNAELGFRGRWKWLSWDVNGFLLQYNNRFGTLVQTDNAGTFYTYRTNIGNSFTKGIEALLQADWTPAPKWMISVFSSTALADARYTSGEIKSGNNNISIKGKKVESAPSVISRSGFTIRYYRLSISGLCSYTSATYADPLNTALPSASGSVGLVPAYSILDLNAGIHIMRGLDVRLSMNNLADKRYFTKRPAFYPGPGVWTSDGRNCTATVSIKL
ncbi:MAG: TonB-dependent receptor [Bacteroidetes bacterium]|nr:TonB-dependent receptor [Bacteroidota bacterium]